MNIGLFDMDGSLCDYEGQLRQNLETLMSPDELETTKFIDLWELDDIPHYRERIKLIKNQVGWWRKLPIIRKGLAVYDIAKSIGFENHILTKGPKRNANAWKEKVEWCQDLFGEDINVHITSDKGLVYGKFLYDDYPDYMVRWLSRRPRGLGIMPVTNFNKGFIHPQVIKHDNNLDEIEEALRICFNRKVKHEVENDIWSNLGCH